MTTRKGLPYSVEKQPAGTSKKYQQDQSQIFEKVILTSKNHNPSKPTYFSPKPKSNKPKFSYFSTPLTFLLAATAVYTTISVDWSVFNEVMFPKLAKFHTEHNINKLAVHRQRREAEIKNNTKNNKVNQFSSHFILKDVKEIPLDEWNKMNKVQNTEITTQKIKDFDEYLYPQSEYVPLGQLERIYVTTGYHGLKRVS